MTSVEQRLQLLEDERAILRTLYTYCHSIDYGLEDQFSDLWCEDATLAFSFDVAMARTATGLTNRSFDGRTEIIEFFRAHTHAPDQYHKHLLLDPRIEVDGDRATAQTYYIRLDEQLAGPVMSSFGRYIDELVRSPDGRWRLRSRQGQAENRVPNQQLFRPE